MRNRHTHLLASAAVLALTGVLAGCGSSATSSSSSASTAPAAGTTARVLTVVISGYAFHPVNLDVPRGSRVQFINRDSTAHTATTTSPGFDSGTLKQGQGATVSLTKAGRYAYICQFHAFMQGTVTVS